MLESKDQNAQQLMSTIGNFIKQVEGGYNKKWL